MAIPTSVKARLLVIVAVLAAAALVPIRYLAAPGWDVAVVDGSGSPIEGITVRRVYQNYSAEDESHEEDMITNQQGIAVFQPRWVSASVARRFMFTVLAARTGVHASFGRHATVFAFGKGREGFAASGQYVTDWAGSPSTMKTQITARAANDAGRY